MNKAEFYQNILDTIRENYRYPFWAVFELLDNTYNCKVDVDKNEKDQEIRLICTFFSDNSVLYCEFSELGSLINTLVIADK